MRYDDAEMRDKLAAEYVLGTLGGHARRRFERLMRDDRALALLVEEWEVRLNPLAEAAPTVPPPTRVWRAIEREIAGLSGAKSPRSSGLWESLGFWRGFGFAGAAAAAALALYIALVPPALAPTPVAVIQDQTGHPAFLAFATPNGPTIELSPIAAKAPEAGRVFELWLLPGAGAPPRPLGLLPASGKAEFELRPEDRAALSHAAGLAISLEPAGGSPTGLPTGPVLFSGAVIAAS